MTEWYTEQRIRSDFSGLDGVALLLESVGVARERRNTGPAYAGPHGQLRGDQGSKFLGHFKVTAPARLMFPGPAPIILAAEGARSLVYRTALRHGHHPFGVIFAASDWATIFPSRMTNVSVANS